MKLKNKNLILDFDSTIISLEGLDELGRIVLAQNPKAQKIVKSLESITSAGMNGEINFRESLEARLQLFKPTRKALDKLISLLLQNISQSIMNNKKFIERNADRVYIISGGFKEWIIPVAKKLGISAQNVYANEFIFDENGSYKSFNKTNYLSRERGKVDLVCQLNLDGKNIIVGDGMTDYQIYREGYADSFIYFAENVSRKQVMIKANFIAHNFDEVIKYVI